MKKYLRVVPGILLLSTAAFAQSGDLKQVKGLAEECIRAFVADDFDKVADLTYPKVVEMMGGKEKTALFFQVVKLEMEAQGMEAGSFTASEPKRAVRVGTKLLVIVPYTLKMKWWGEAVLTQRSYYLGVSDVMEKKWTFIDGTTLDKMGLKQILPEAVGRIALPKQQKPFFEKNLKGAGGAKTEN
jgi:hypothetical protein